MYKSKLQELCHQKQWSLPQYSTTKEGPMHIPRFTTAVTVNGLSFETPNPSNSSKESQNEAAKLALDHFSAPPKPPAEPPIIAPTPKPPIIAPPPRCPSEPLIIGAPLMPPAPPEATDDSRKTVDMSEMIASLKSLQPKLPEEYLPPGLRMAQELSVPLATSPEECRASQANQNKEAHAPQANQSVKDDAPVRDVWHLSKNQLQMYAQKRNLPLPTYSCEREGPPHASRFKCKVNVDGKTFESPDYCSTLKDAEHAAARVALLTMSSTGEQERDSGLYKNLLQEFAQKEGYHLPLYETNGAVGQFPTFTSTVVIEGESFTGQPGKTKKQAEMSAAKVAYTTLIERKQNQTSTSRCPAEQGPRVLSSSTGSQRNTTPSISLDISPRVNAVSSFTHFTKRENVHGVTEDMESRSHDHPFPPREAEISTIRKEDSLSDTTHGQLKILALEESSSESSSSENGNMPIATDSAIESPWQAVSIPPPGVVRVYPRALNMTLPQGSVVACSDENWIAVTAGADPN